MEILFIFLRACQTFSWRPYCFSFLPKIFLQFLSLFTSTCYFPFKKKKHNSQVCEVQWPWSLVCIPWLVLLFSIFLCTWWPFIYFWTKCLSPLPLWCWALYVRYICANIFPILWINLHFLDSVLFVQISVTLTKPDLFSFIADASTLSFKYIYISVPWL